MTAEAMISFKDVVGVVGMLPGFGSLTPLHHVVLTRSGTSGFIASAQQRAP